ncbi:Os06g0207783 [Oryza sativa Japonica Group]|uniref:Os06g0207783 protein n=1 Tax=Oryza sativa subsp. japonica TaxID=39947 RepID=A0A0P0WTY2_ORYSJ|nr:hypothetical protein EE612_032589 [Oryza sativa]BAS96714.1 Os06g0207783 [Oryza sativa Japonica Group]
MPFVFTSTRTVDTIRIITQSQRLRVHHQVFVLRNMLVIRPVTYSNFFRRNNMWFALNLWTRQLIEHVSVS